MAINFGQQISAGLESAFDRVDRSRRAGLQAQRLNQQIQEFEHRQQMDRLAARVRQKQMQLQQETREEQLAQQAIENEFTRERIGIAQQQEQRTAANQESMQEYRQAQIQQMQSRGSEGGDSGGSSFDYSNVQTINAQLPDLNSQLLQLQNRRAQLSSSSGGTMLDEAGGAQMEIINRQIQNTVDRINALNQSKAEITGQPAEVIDAGDIIGGASTGGSSFQPATDLTSGLSVARPETSRVDFSTPDESASQQQGSEVQTISSREEFDGLPEGAEFIFNNTRYIKQNGQLVQQ